MGTRLGDESPATVVATRACVRAIVHLHFVINPAAGRRSSVPFCADVAARLEAMGHRVSQYVTRAPGDGTAHVARLDASACDVLGIVGGDGTLAEVVEVGRTASAAFPWPLALIPMGTANLVAREARMPLGRDAQATAEALAQGTPWPVDLMRFRSQDCSRRRAVANLGVGADAQVVATIDGLRAGAVGSGSYLRWIPTILRTVRRFRFEPMRVIVDEHLTVTASACVIQNARSYGGLFELSPEAGLSSDQLDVIVLRGRTGRDLLRLGVQGLLRRVKHDRGARILAAQRVRVVAPAPSLCRPTAIPPAQPTWSSSACRAR